MTQKVTRESKEKQDGRLAADATIAGMSHRHFLDRMNRM